MEPELEYQIEKLISKTKHYIITTAGKVSSEANPDEFYRALSYTLREEIMINWLAAAQSMDKMDSRILYYLSMEYLPGRVLSNSITNLSSNEVLKAVLQRMNRTYFDVISRESDPGLGNGGLGRLASCFLDSLATMHYPAQAYGLRYQYGIFEQQLWDGVQVEAPDCWLIRENPWEFRRDLRKRVVKYCGQASAMHNIHGDEIHSLSNYEEVYALPYDVPIVGYGHKGDFSVVTLRLWSTKESPRNFQLQRYNAGNLDQAAENTALTDVLYPCDHHDTGRRTRLKQEFLLVSASLQDIIRHYLERHENFRDFADKVRIQINDTHPTLVIPELIRILTKQHDLPWRTAVDITCACMGYTNHTILREALEEWDSNLFDYLLPRQYKVIERLNQEFCDTIRDRYPDDEEKVRRLSIIEGDQVRMAHLAIVGSHKVNGVAALHTEIIKNKVFKEFYELFPDRFVNVTNGVTHRRWLLHSNPRLARFISRKIGDDWLTDFSQIAQLAEYAKDPEMQQEFLKIKLKNKERLVEFLKNRGGDANFSREIQDHTPLIDVHTLFDVQIKRIHEYKRQMLNLLHLIIIYQEMLENPDHHRIGRTAIFSGKAAPGYEVAKSIVRLTYCMARTINKDTRIKGALKIVFIENYNVSRAEVIIPAADLSEQISTAGMEASGTGNMKLSMNGALTIGTEDGANIEMREAVTDEWWPFSFGCSAEEIEAMKREDTYQPRDIYQANPKIRSAVDTLRDGTFSINDQENEEFSKLFHRLLDDYYGESADQYFVLRDLENYYKTQLKVEALFKDRNRWAEYAIRNIAGMGPFSTDRSIQDYVDRIWGLEQCPLDPEILSRIRHEYSEHDRCRIY